MKDDLIQNKFRDPEASDARSPCNTPGPAVRLSLGSSWGAQQADPGEQEEGRERVSEPKRGRGGGWTHKVNEKEKGKAKLRMGGSEWRLRNWMMAGSLWWTHPGARVRAPRSRAGTGGGEPRQQKGTRWWLGITKAGELWGLALRVMGTPLWEVFHRKAFVPCAVDLHKLSSLWPRYNCHYEKEEGLQNVPKNLVDSLGGKNKAGFYLLLFNDLQNMLCF